MGTIVLTPSGDREGAVDVTVVVGVNASSDDCVKRDFAGCIRARRRVRFVPHESLTMPIELSLVCLGVECNPEKTCFRGACVSPEFTARGGCIGPECHDDSDSGGVDASSDTTSDVTTPPDASLDAPVVVSDGAASDPELVVQTTSIPRGLALAGADLFWSEAAGTGATTIHARNIQTNTPTGTPFDLQPDVYGLAVSGTNLAYAVSGTANRCGNFNASTNGVSAGADVICTYDNYVGVALLASGSPVFVGGNDAFAIGAGKKEPVAFGGYAEATGTIATYASSNGIEVWDTSTSQPPRAITMPDAVRGHASASAHWLASTKTGTIYAVAKSELSAPVPNVVPISRNQFAEMEDIAWDEPSKTLYVGAVRGGQYGIYRLRNLEGSFPGG